MKGTFAILFTAFSLMCNQSWSQTIAHFDSLFEKQKQLPDNPEKVAVLKHLIRSYSAFNSPRLNEAGDYNIAVAKRLKNDSLLMLAYSEKGDYGKGGVAYFDSCYALAKKLNNKTYLAACLAAYGGMESDKRNYSKAIEYWLESAKYSEEINKHDYTLYRYMNIAEIFGTAGDSAKQLYYGKKAIQLALQIGDTEAIAETSNSIAEIYLKQKDLSKARYYNNLSFKWAEYSGLESNKLFSIITRGRIYGKEKKYGLAISDMNTVISLGKSVDKWAAFAYYYLAEYAFENKKYDEALTNANKALEILKQKRPGRKLSDVDELLYKIYLVKRNYPNALHYHELWIANRDSINNVEKTNKINELETVYQSEKRIRRFNFSLKTKP